MNITELARILRVPTQELRDKLPQVGFDIGQKAIKVDDKIAARIISQWAILNKQLEAKLSAEKRAAAAETTVAGQEKKQIKIPAFITVRDLAAITGLPVNRILSELMKNGIFSSLNEKIDFDTAAVIGADLGLNIAPAEETEETKAAADADIIKTVLSQEAGADLKTRPPVVVVWGTLTTVKPNCWTPSEKPTWWPAKPAALLSTSAPIR